MAIKSKDIDWNNVDKQIKAGVKRKDIATKLGITPAALHNRMLRRAQAQNSPLAVIGTKEFAEYKENQADILLHLQKRILASITEQDIEKATLQSRATSYAIFKDKERLERGLSTSNMSLFCHIAQQAEDSITVEDLRSVN